MPDGEWGYKPVERFNGKSKPEFGVHRQAGGMGHAHHHAVTGMPCQRLPLPFFFFFGFCCTRCTVSK